MVDFIHFSMETIYSLTLIGLFWVLLIEPKALKTSMVISTEISDKQNKESSIQPEIQQVFVEVNVANRYSKTSITSKVQNNDTKTHEATFAVIIPDKAFISGFVMEIDRKEYKAYVQEKEKAKQIYNNAFSKGYSAGHVEINARDSNRFTVSVSIQPQSNITFYLTYEQLLERKEEKYEIVLNVHPGQLVKNFTVQVNIIESCPIKFVKVPSVLLENQNKDVTTTLYNTSAVVKFSPDIQNQKMLAENLGTEKKNGSSGQFVVQYDVERDPNGEVLVDDGYFVHFFAPENLTPINKQIVFVLDTSSSMLGHRITQLKEAMDSILSQLHPKDIFSIVTFNALVYVWNITIKRATYQTSVLSTDYEAYSEEKLPGSFPASEFYIENAKKVVKSLESFGATNIYSALKIAMEIVAMNENSNIHPMIVFLTDGEPTYGITNTKKIISKITELNIRKAPLFALSFGSGADKQFLEELALKNQGFSRHIYDAADSYIQLENFYKQISSPLLSNVTFKYTGAVAETTKSSFPLLFHGCELYVSGKVNNPEFQPKVEACISNGTEVQFTPKVYSATRNLERLWVYLTLRQLLEQRKVEVDKAGPTREALRLALKYSFVTEVSSLVVVKPDDASFKMQFEAAYDESENRENQFIKNRVRSSYFSAIRQPSALPVQDYMFDVTPSPNQSIVSEVKNSEKLLNNTSWLKNIFNKNKTLTIDSVSYSLGLEKKINISPKCQNSINNSSGKCTLLHECPGNHQLLASFEVYKKHFCILESLYAGVCCPMSAVH